MKKKVIYTLGYQGININSYVETLRHNGVGLVIDVREVAWSYKVGFSKAPLQAALNEAGIEYLHLKSAGNPSKYRKNSRTVKECLSKYRAFLGRNLERVDVLINEIEAAQSTGKAVCLTCFEKNPDECHRSILLDYLTEQKPRTKIMHLHYS